MKVFFTIIQILLLSGLAHAQTGGWNIPATFDGGKFAQRYGLNPQTDFWVTDGKLWLRNGIKLADNPPTFDTQDSLAKRRHARAKAALDKQDGLSDSVRAILLTLLEQINVLRAAIPHPLQNLTRSGSTVTATTPMNHGFSPGDTVTVFGADQNGYNGVQTIVATPTNSTFTYTIGGTPATPATGTLFYFYGDIPGATKQITKAQAVQAIKDKLDAGDAD